MVATLLFVRLRPGLGVGERLRVVHIAELPDGHGQITELETLCGEVFGPGVLELIERFRGMPCEKCIARRRRRLLNSRRGAGLSSHPQENGALLAEVQSSEGKELALRVNCEQTEGSDEAKKIIVGFTAYLISTRFEVSVPPVMEFAADMMNEVPTTEPITEESTVSFILGVEEIIGDMIAGGEWPE